MSFFEISDTTKAAAIEAMKKSLPGHTDAEYEKAFFEAVAEVRKQFGF
jgi:hypothetical protein